jgi:hypothetical protein
MSAQDYPPTLDDLPTGFVESDGVHAQAWEETDRAAERTVRARRKVGALAASFNAVGHAADFDRICREASIDAGELRRVYMTILELAMRAEDHAERDGLTPAAVRRFHCPDYAAELCYRREALGGSTEEEKAKRRASLSRAWRERFRRTVHAAQCRNHLPLVERESGGIFGHRKVATVYTERLSDVLTATAGGVDRNRGRVTRYTRAAESALDHLRHSAPPYAPDFEPDQEPDDPPPALETDADAISDPPYIRALRRAVRLAKKGMTAAPPEEYAARRTELHEWIDALMPESPDPEPKNTHPPFSSVGISVDASKNEDAEGGMRCAEVVTKTHISDGENCGFSPENDDLSEKKGDVNIPTNPPFTGTEYDPEPEPRGINLAEATAAADACASVGVEHVLVVWTDETLPVGENCGGTDEFKSIAEFQADLPRLLKRNEQSPVESMAVRVRWKGETNLLQVDDCPPEVLETLAPYSFMQIATSPGNGQAWLAFSETLTQERYDELKRRLFTRLNPTNDKQGANGGAHGSVRWPGSLNRKPKRRYADGASPRVQLLSVQPGRKVSVAELDAAGLLAPPPPKKTPEQVREIKGRLPSGWPDLDEFLHRHAGDRSRAEFAWSCRALEVGWPQYRVEEELAQIGAKARTRTRDAYITDTVTNAALKVGVRAV